jgi:pteridine reductase
VTLRGRVAFVTGAGRRVGKAIAIALAEAGADLVLHVHTSTGEDVVREAKAFGGNVLVIQENLGGSGTAARLVKEAERRSGKIDIVVNNAGVFFPAPLSSLSESTWHDVLRINLTAPFVISLWLGRAMQRRGGGKIIHVGDWLGQRPAPRYVSYCVAKAGLHSLTQALAKAFAPIVQVNEVVLGPILPPSSYNPASLTRITEQTPLGKVGRTQDVTRTVRFLAETKNFITGASYVVDGGWLANVPYGIDISV